MLRTFNKISIFNEILLAFIAEQQIPKRKKVTESTETGTKERVFDSL